MVATPSGYYYFGGYDMNAKEITVLIVERGQHPKVTTFKDDLDSILGSKRATDIVEGFKCGKASEELCRRCGYAQRFV